MTFSQYAGVSIIPTLARIVLGMAFISLGWCQLNEKIEYDPSLVEKLRELGVDVEAQVSNVEDAAAWRTGDARIHFASYVQDPEQSTQPPEGEGEAQDPPAEQPPTELVDPDSGAEAAQAQPDADAAGGDINTVYMAERMHKITLALDKRGLTQYARLIALGAVIGEIVAGALILIGLFSRLCGLVLAAGAGAAIYFHSMKLFVITGNPLYLASSENLELFNILFRHLGLLVLALGVMLTGPGPLSLDRLLFKRDTADLAQDDEI